MEYHITARSACRKFSHNTVAYNTREKDSIIEQWLTGRSHFESDTMFSNATTHWMAATVDVREKRDDQTDKD